MNILEPGAMDTALVEVNGCAYMVSISKRPTPISLNRFNGSLEECTYVRENRVVDGEEILSKCIELVDWGEEDDPKPKYVFRAVKESKAR